MATLNVSHDPYSCPVCLGIGKLASRFPLVIRGIGGTAGMAAGLVISPSAYGAFVGGATGLLVAEIVGAVIVHMVRVWLSNRIALLNDPGWVEARNRCLAAMQERQRRCDEIFDQPFDVSPVQQYRTRR